MKGTNTIKVNYLARVEGEGALHLEIRNGDVREVKLKIFEPPRFFEGFLRGRHYTEVPDITARICGICPIAYQMSSVHAMEDALGMHIDGPIRALRRLIYCGEWIESHVLHIYMLHAPDFLGYQDAIQMAADHADVVKQGLELKKIGNDLVTLIGGREIHPINVRVGGFYKVPRKRDLEPIKERLKRARDLALATVAWTAKLPFPGFEMDYTFVCLRHDREYPFNEGRLVSNKGLDISIHDYFRYFEEQHVAHSNALHGVMKGQGPYFVGPLARYSNNFDRLPEICQQAAKDAGLGETCKNPFKSIIVRAVETLFAVDEALRIIVDYQQPESPYIETHPKTSTGHGCSEAPRGILYHRYRIDGSGQILDAKIVPPTSQNQKQIESDLWHFVPKHMHLDKDELTWKCEQAIRNYDPCISCATHFLNLTIDRQ